MTLPERDFVRRPLASVSRSPACGFATAQARFFANPPLWRDKRFQKTIASSAASGLSHEAGFASSSTSVPCWTSKPVVGHRLFTLARDPLPFFVAMLGFLVPLMAIGLGFDTVNGEHNRRTLSRILSQPIYRDALLFGKFLAGLGW